MKKIAGLGVGLALVVAMVSGALAIGPGMDMGPGMDQCMCQGKGQGKGMMGAGYNKANLTPEEAKKVEQFRKDIAPLREKMFQLRTEMMTLRSQQNPDWNAIGEKQKAMVDLKTQIRQKADEYGVAGMGPGACDGQGRMGKGRMMRGMAM